MESKGVSENQWKEDVTKLGQSIITEVTKREKSNRLQSSGETFVARLVSVTMENFLGVREPLIISAESMRDGVWFLTGANGSGKVRMRKGGRRGGKGEGRSGETFVTRLVSATMEKFLEKREPLITSARIHARQCLVSLPLKDLAR